MTKISVDVHELTGNAQALHEQGGNIKMNPLNQTLSNTDIEPFKGFEALVLDLQDAVKHYGDIVTKDARAVQHVINEFKNKDQEIANQINNNTQR